MTDGLGAIGRFEVERAGGDDAGERERRDCAVELGCCRLGSVFCKIHYRFEEVHGSVPANLGHLSTFYRHDDAPEM